MKTSENHINATDNRAIFRNVGCSIFDVLSHIRTALWLIIALVIVLIIGSLQAGYMMQYKELRFTLLPDWLLHQPLQVSWWIYALMALFFLFFINTAACIINRLVSRSKQHKISSARDSVRLLLPTAVHFSFLFVILGFCLTEFSGLREHIPATADSFITVDNVTLRVLDQQCHYRNTLKAMAPSRACSATLQLSHDNTQTMRTISLLHPFRSNGISYHLAMADKPKVINNRIVPQLEIIVKKDYGLPLIFVGDTLMCLFLLLLYLRFKKPATTNS